MYKISEKLNGLPVSEAMKTDGLHALEGRVAVCRLKKDWRVMDFIVEKGDIIVCQYDGFERNVFRKDAIRFSEKEWLQKKPSSEILGRDRKIVALFWWQFEGIPMTFQNFESLFEILEPESEQCEKHFKASEKMIKDCQTFNRESKEEIEKIPCFFFRKIEKKDKERHEKLNAKLSKAASELDALRSKDGWYKSSKE